MKFPGPDAALLAAYEAHERASVAKSQSIGQSGRQYAPRCSNVKKCGRGPSFRVETLGQKGAIVYRCRWCGTVWDWSDAFILAGQSHSGRGGKAPAALERTGDLCILIRDLDATTELEPGHAEIYSTWLLAGSKSQETLATDATRILFKGHTWKPRDVRRAISRSRGWLSDELERRGLMAEPEGGGRGAIT